MKATLSIILLQRIAPVSRLAALEEHPLEGYTFVSCEANKRKAKFLIASGKPKSVSF
jgi:hypothetical protein